MKRIVLILWLLVLWGTGVKAEFKRIVWVDKKVSELKDTIDLSSPLGAFAASAYMQAKGNDSVCFDKIFTFRFCPLGKSYKDREVKPEVREEILNREVKQVVYYNDSVAGVISTLRVWKDEYRYLLTGSVLENGRWVNAGEQPVKSVEEGRLWLKERLAPVLDKYVRYVSRISHVSTDTMAFIRYVRSHGQKPEDFLLDALKRHRIVLYGEHHFYKPSWDLMKRLVQRAEFPEIVGTVFLEMKRGNQKRINQFLNGEKLNRQLLLDILGGDYQYGWNDKGMYEFLITLWEVNQKLSPAKKIRVIFPDFGLSWLDIQTEDDFKRWNNHSFQDRDACMADVTEKIIRENHDSRGNLFIVGGNHACKHANGVPSLGNLLRKKFSDKEVYSVLLHTVWGDNSGNVFGKIRKGLFDYVFQTNGNKPVAFALADSPFGQEPFDFDLEYQGVPLDGTFEENFDAYVFLQPLEEDKVGYYLVEEMYTDSFVDEIKRRCKLSGDKYPYQGVRLEDFSKEWRINQLNGIKDKKKYPMFEKYSTL